MSTSEGDRTAMIKRLWATIRQQSKYYPWQQDFDRDGKAIPFPIEIDFFSDPDWPVRGNQRNGGCYSLYDVDLWVETEGKMTKLPVHERPEDWHL